MTERIPQLRALADRAFSARPLILKPTVFLPAVLAVFLAAHFWQLGRTVGDAGRLKEMISEDSAHYIQIARSFAAGDFSMSYVERRPHRQPLYPLLLAPAVRLGGGSPLWLGSVNVLIGAVTILVLYFGMLKLHGSPLIAAAVTLLYAANSMIGSEVTGRLMTEPLHILLVVLAIFCFLACVATRRAAALWAASALAALDYLARPNGLFLMASMMGVLFFSEIFGPGTAGESRAGRLSRCAAKYLAAGILFLIVAAPSWLPRLHYLGQPLSHGYLSNFLWVDTYAEAHTGQAHAEFTWRDYAARHNAADFLGRWAHGFGETLSLAWRNDRIFGIRLPILFLLSAAGLAVSIFTRNRAYLLLAAFFLLQLLPLIWTTLSNPTDRVPYASILPFELFFAAFALAALAGRVCGGDRNGSPVGRERQSGPYGTGQSSPPPASCRVAG